MRWVERYCVRHPRFGVENLMRYLIIGNAVVWLLTLMDRTGTVRYFLALNPQMVLRGQIWRLATFVLIPDTGGIWGLLFLYFYYFIGTSMEREWGQAKFNMYFLAGMVFTILYAFLVYLFGGITMSIGSGVHLSFDVLLVRNVLSRPAGAVHVHHPDQDQVARRGERGVLRL